MLSCRSFFLKMNSENDDIVVLIQDSDDESGGGGGSSIPPVPPQPTAIRNTDTVYNSSGGYSRAYGINWTRICTM